MSFTGHRQAVTAVDGVEREHTYPPDTAVLAGAGAPVDWVRVSEPSEGIEVSPTAEVLDDVGEQTGRCTVDLAEGVRYLRASPQLWARFARLRSLVLTHADVAEVEALVHEITVEAAVATGGRVPKRPGALGPRELRKVVEILDQRAGLGVGLRELAAHTAMSPYHLLRAFRTSTGVSPHGYITAIRLSRARRALAVEGSRVADVAREVGYADERQFRRAYHAAFGTSPRDR